MPRIFKVCAEETALNNAIARCHSPGNKSYADYGARGIKVCDRWRYGAEGLTRFRTFLLDMGSKPTPGHTLERMDNNGNYEPSNCRWATRLDQGNNKRNNAFLTVSGETLSRSEWAAKLGIDEAAIRNRVRRGWSIEDAVTKPKFANGSGKFIKSISPVGLDHRVPEASREQNHEQQYRR